MEKSRRTQIKKKGTRIHIPEEKKLAKSFSASEDCHTID